MAAGVVAVVVVAVVVAGEVTRVKTPLERVARAVLSEGSEKKRPIFVPRSLKITPARKSPICQPSSEDPTALPSSHASMRMETRVAADEYQG